MPETSAPTTMKEMIDRDGWITRFRWWLFKQLSRSLYWICPEPHRSMMQVMWMAKLGEFKNAAASLQEPEKK